MSEATETLLAPAASAPAASPEAGWKKHLGGLITSAVMAVAVAVLTALITTHTTTARLEERISHLDKRIDQEGDATNLENIINNHRHDLDETRTQMTPLNVACGRLDVAVHRATCDISTLRAEVALMGKQAARMEAMLEVMSPSKDGARGEKVVADLAAIRERLAVIEAAIAVKQTKLATTTATSNSR